MTPSRYVAGAAAIVLAIGVYLATRLAKRHLNGPVEPVGLFLLAWTVALTLFAIPWVRYTPTSTTAWMAIYGSIAAFVLGALTAYWVVPGSVGRLLSAEYDVDARRLRLMLLASLVLAWIGFAAFLHAVDIVVGWPKVFTNAGLVRSIEDSSTKFQSAYGPWKLLTYFGAISFLFWTVAIRARAFHGRTRVLYAVGPLTIVPYLFTTDRSQLLTAIAWTAMFHLLWRPLHSVRQLILPAVATAIVILAAFLFLAGRKGETINEHPEIAAALTSQTFRELAMPYLYVTSDAPLFTKLIHDPNHPHGYGAFTFRPAVKLASAVGLAGSPPPAVPTPFYPIPFQTFNNASWLAPFYLDYGLAGCLILPGVIGFGIALLAKKTLVSRSVLGTWLLSVLALGVIFTPIAEKFSDTITWELAGLGIVLSGVLKGGALSASWVGGAHQVENALRARRPVVMWSAGALAVLCAAMGVAILKTTAQPPDPANATELRRALAVAGEKARRAFVDGGYPFPATLASQLHVSDPAVNYQPLASPTDVPTDRGTIGVFTTTTAAVFDVQDREGAILELQRVETGPWRGTYGPRPMATGLQDGSFEPPNLSWAISSGQVATVAFTSQGSNDARTRLLVRGTGHGGAPTTVTQGVPGLAGTRPLGSLVLRVRYRTVRLSRPLGVELKFTYMDGSYEFFTARALGSSGLDGIPPGTSRGWRMVTASGLARSTLASVRVFVVDTGTRFLTGTAWIDDASLVLTRR